MKLNEVNTQGSGNTQTGVGGEEAWQSRGFKSEVEGLTKRQLLTKEPRECEAKGCQQRTAKQVYKQDKL